MGLRSFEPILTSRCPKIGSRISFYEIVNCPQSMATRATGRRLITEVVYRADIPSSPFSVFQFKIHALEFHKLPQ